VPTFTFLSILRVITFLPKNCFKSDIIRCRRAIPQSLNSLIAHRIGNILSPYKNAIISWFYAHCPPLCTGYRVLRKIYDMKREICCDVKCIYFILYGWIYYLNCWLGCCFLNASPWGIASKWTLLRAEIWTLVLDFPASPLNILTSVPANKLPNIHS